ncbi:hypothetical protein ASG25_10660 [Rhizobium sp. Leaf384]|uniref:hypothetical protein n=1 Tax=Rhizobium sp. Leaf384 TaxID=1736358 RepID=UPI000713058F|nr:hypothetical protein [Rhizobium sp. Leaf384]KQS79039.1 hypothetical protein ASG25_10660 [Rhizobium sp. Leaf384]
MSAYAYLPFVADSAVLALNGSTHGGGVVVVASRAAGITMTLPKNMGHGTEFDIFVGTSITSNNLIIQVADAVDTISGVCITAQDAGDTVVAFETAPDSDTITMNGSTKGGIKGDRIKIKAVQPGVWAVQVICSGTGTEATPFSAAVS